MENYKVVLVSEENSLLRKIEQILTDIEVSFEVTKSTKLLIEKCKSENFDLVLCNLELPELENLIHSVRTDLNKPVNEIPILLITDATNFINQYNVKAIVPNFDSVDFENALFTLLEDSDALSENDNSVFTSAKLYDLSYLNDYADGDNVFIKEMIGMFVHHIPDLLETLKQSYLDKNWDMVRKNAHKMKSQLSFIGLDFCMKQMELIEKYAGEHSNLTAIPEMSDKITEYCNMVIVQLKHDFDIKDLN